MIDFVFLNILLALTINIHAFLGKINFNRDFITPSGLITYGKRITFKEDNVN